MDTETIGNLLKAIRDAVSKPNQSDDDVALPVFDSEKSDNGATRWCNNIETLAKDLNWSSIKTAAKAGKALKGSALIWFESWDPLEGRSWEKFRADIIDAYPEKKNLSDRLQKAVLFTSDAADSYGEYAREKLRLLRNTTVAFTEEQLIELVCGGVSDVNVRMASLNSNVASTSLLISLLSSYSKNKRPLESNCRDSSSGPSGAKRFKNENEKKCFICNQTGHFQSQCVKNKVTQLPPSVTQAPPVPKPNENRVKHCTFCKKIGHLESVCFHKQRAENRNSTAITVVPTTSGVNFLGKPN